MAIHIAVCAKRNLCVIPASGAGLPDIGFSEVGQSEVGKSSAIK